MHKRKKRPIILLVFLLVILVIFIFKTASFYPFLFQLVFNRGINLTQTADGRVNVLLLGIGGGSHDGPNLTDTIIFASLDAKNNKATLISIPRDLWFPDINQKVNAAYANGESKRKGGGIVEAEAVMKKVTGQNVDYAVRLDFSGFVKAVDIVGGLDVNVDNTFDDYQYPIDGNENNTCGHSQDELKTFASDSADQAFVDFPCRYQHIHFNKGINHMGGETALEFVRSRHASGLEGSDFARSKRQQKVISAFKNKLLSAQTLINPGKIISLYTVLSGSIDTNIKQSEFDDFIRLGQKMKTAKIQSATIDTGDSQSPGFLLNPPITSDYNYTWVLIPKVGNGNFTEIQNFIACEIKSGNCHVSATVKK